MARDDEHLPPDSILLIEVFCDNLGVHSLAEMTELLESLLIIDVFFEERSAAPNLVMAARWRASVSPLWASSAPEY